jgi:hypothetical protein
MYFYKKEIENAVEAKFDAELQRLPQPGYSV